MSGVLWILLGAALLDALVGDPQVRVHPVRLLGDLIEWLGRFRSGSWIRDRTVGWILAVGLVGVAGLGTWGLLEGVREVGGWYAEVGTGIVLFTLCISHNDLQKHVRAVEQSLRQGDLEGARKYLSWIVGRDTEELEWSEISRAAVETTGEGYLDGILSPLFWFVVGGVPLAMAQKTASTLDSMWGYEDPDWRWFGEGAARLDDLANWIPARLCLVLISLSALAVGLDWRRALRIGWEQRNDHPSPNAGHPEALFAGALDCRLGGPATYGGREGNRPWIHPDGTIPKREHVTAARRLCTASYGFTLAIAGLVLMSGWFPL